ncbi:MAG TPA: hypothetical protein VFX31_05375 [Ktedonobacterales bacterium]|nr:hypothetical protein [Ktedonobacterales bacterium]
MAAQLETFYQTVSQVCFTLLGFWLIVLQTKYQEWSGKAERRRMIVNISLYFLLPGTMSLLAMLAIQATAIWRVAFVVTSAVGVIETVLMLGSLQKSKMPSRVGALTRIMELILFTLTAVVGLFPQEFNRFGLTALTVAGVLLTLMVVGGVALMWIYLIEPVEPVEPTKPAVPVERSAFPYKPL